LKLPNLKPEDVREADGSIKWKFVDTWLTIANSPGDVARLGKHLGIALGTLRKRRKKKKLNRLPPGRPRVKELSPRQHHVITQLKEGKTVSAIAAELNVSPQAVHSAKHHAVTKQRTEKNRCSACDGRGITYCSSCRGIGPHNHVCHTCMGDGYIFPKE